MAFTYYSPISVNAAQVPSTQTDFPILISVTDNRFKSVGNGGHVQSSSGFDIRPYSDSGLTTAITGYELERYNATTGEVVMWVKIASLSSSTTPVYLAYGDSGISTDSSSTTTWSNSFTAVYHLKDGTTLSVADSTAGSHTGTNSGVVTATAGKIDGGGGFVSASSQYIDTTSSVSSVAVTLSAWVKATSFPNAYNCAIGWNGSNVNYARLMVKSTGKLAMYTNVANYDGTGTNTLSTATFYYLAMTYSSSAGLVGYVNGASDGTAAAGAALFVGSLISAIGRDAFNTGTFWNGVIDEGRYASVVRSANWITTEYNNQNAPGTFATLGTEVNVGGGPVRNSNWLLFFT